MNGLNKPLSTAVVAEKTMSRIDMLFSAMSNATAKIDVLMDEMESTLSPMLRPEPPINPDGGSDVNASSEFFTEALNRMGHINYKLDRISSVLERFER